MTARSGGVLVKLDLLSWVIRVRIGGGLTLVLGSGLNASLRGVWEQTTRDTEEDLRADDARVVCATGAAAEVDEQAEGDGEEGGADDDEGLEVADEADDDAGDDAGDDGDEAVERADARGRLDGLVEGDDEDRVQVVALHVPGGVEHDGYEEGAPHAAVFEEVEGDHGVFAVLLPEDEDGDGEDAEDEGRDDLGRLPGLLDAAGESEGHEDEREDGDDEDDADDVELPEELDGELFPAEGLEGRLE